MFLITACFVLSALVSFSCGMPTTRQDNQQIMLEGGALYPSHSDKMMNGPTRPDVTDQEAQKGDLSSGSVKSLGVSHHGTIRLRSTSSNDHESLENTDHGSHQNRPAEIFMGRNSDVNLAVSDTAGIQIGDQVNNIHVPLENKGDPKNGTIIYGSDAKDVTNDKMKTSAGQPLPNQGHIWHAKPSNQKNGEYKDFFPVRSPMEKKNDTAMPTMSLGWQVGLPFAAFIVLATIIFIVVVVRRRRQRSRELSGKDSEAPAGLRSETSLTAYRTLPTEKNTSLDETRTTDTRETVFSNG